jgi:BMFP domain-containing protein YqiC
MLDDVLLSAIKRFWNAEKVENTYAAILDAYLNRLEKVTVIVGKATEGDSANAQVVVSSQDYREWMETLEARLAELENAASGAGTTHTGTEHVIHSNRFVST